MAPDLNSLPTSRPPSVPASPQSSRSGRNSWTSADALRPSPPPPRSPSLSSLQAAATINAGLHLSTNPSASGRMGLERRRSSLMNNFSINDPTIPAPGELQHSNGSNVSSPHSQRRSFAGSDHQRQPSLGELHQELENEQEAQVNRLLQMIRIQQDQLANIQRHHQQQQQQQHQPAQRDSLSSSTQQTHLPGSPAVAYMATAFASNDYGSASLSPNASGTLPLNSPFNRPSSISRQSSHHRSVAETSSRGTSPRLRPQSSNAGHPAEAFLSGGIRDECAFYQAETQTLTRENHMLKLRIRELERQITEMSGPTTSTHVLAASPHNSSPLATQPATFTAASMPSIPAEAEPAAKLD